MSIENHLSVPTSNNFRLNNQTSINTNPNQRIRHSSQKKRSSGFSPQPIQEKIYAKYSTLNTDTLREDRNLIEKSYMSGSHEESLEEYQRPIKHGNSKIYSKGMEGLYKKNSARKIKYTYAKSKNNFGGSRRLTNESRFKENYKTDFRRKKSGNFDNFGGGSQSIGRKQVTKRSGMGKENSRIIQKTDRPTIPVQMKRQIKHPGNFENHQQISQSKKIIFFFISFFMFLFYYFQLFF